MFPVPYSQFGIQDASLYDSYLRASAVVGAAICGVDHSSLFDGRSSFVGRSTVRELFQFLVESNTGVRQSGVVTDARDSEHARGDCGRSDVDDADCVGSHDGRSPSGSSRPTLATGDTGVGASGGGGADGANTSAGSSGTAGVVLGKHNERNKKKRERRKALARQQKEKSKCATSCAGSEVPEWRKTAKCNSGCPSLSNSAVTVDTRTEMEIEAANTLAARRVVENRIAIAKGNRTLKSFQNKAKTAALETLDAARLECRINTATERSQKAYSNQDKSLKSVGSAASAGEFAVKKMAATCADQARQIASLKAQVKAALTNAPAAAWKAVAAIPEPERVSVRDVMGEPNEKWGMRLTNTFYNILNKEAAGDYDSDWRDMF